MSLEKKLSGKYIKCTGVLKGLKIPVEYRGQWVVVCQGNVLGGYTSKQAFGMNKLIRENDSEVHPVILDVPTEEEKIKHAYAS